MPVPALLAGFAVLLVAGNLLREPNPFRLA